MDRCSNSGESSQRRKETELSLSLLSQQKEDQRARKGRKSRFTVRFPNVLWLRGFSQGRLDPAAGAGQSGLFVEMKNWLCYVGIQELHYCKHA